MSAAEVVILMGGPGAGKGTQAARMSERVNLAHISTGDLFRANISENTELGTKAKGFMESGQLVPDELVLDMLFDRVTASDCATGYILDGFPRTLAQAEALTTRLEAGGRSTNVTVVEIKVPDEIIVGRIAGRLLCRACGNIQHREFNPPAKDGACDSCGGELYQRKDDSAETVQERLSVYHNETAPVIGYYSKAGLLQEVDGTQSPDAVFESLIQLVPSATCTEGGA